MYTVKVCSVAICCFLLCSEQFQGEHTLVFHKRSKFYVQIQSAWQNQSQPASHNPDCQVADFQAANNKTIKPLCLKQLITC